MRFAVFTSGHTGSTWLARALDCPRDGVAVFHEPVRVLAYDVLVTEHVPPVPEPPRLLEMLDPYVQWARHREREFEVFGEVHTGPGLLWERAQHLLPENRYFLVRNPIQVVHSMTMSFVYNGTPSECLFATRMAPASLADLPLEQRAFAGLCGFIGDQPAMAKRLGAKEVLRLEDLTTTQDALPAAYHRITGRSYDISALAATQARDVKRKIPGRNDPANLFWNVWTDWMRETFVDACIDTVSAFGYALPDKEDAPAESDPLPFRPIPKAPFLLGPLAPVWAFTSNPKRPAVIVCGDRQCTIGAVILLGEQACVLREEGWSERNVPGDIRLTTLDEAAAAVPPPGVFVAHPNPDDALLSSLRSRFPRSELVRMHPEPLSAEQLEALTGTGKSSRAKPAAAIEHIAGLSNGDCFAGWSIRQLRATLRAIQVTIASESGLTAELEAHERKDAHHVLFPVGRDGALYYHPIAFDLKQMTAACTAIAERIGSATGGLSMAEALAVWRKDAGL